MKLVRHGVTSALLLACAAFFCPQPALCLTCTSTLSAGANIQAAIDADIVGSTICLKGGTYRITKPLVLKSGDVLDGTERKAILNGAKPVTVWTPATNPTTGKKYWYATGQTQHNKEAETVNGQTCAAYANSCETTTYTGCKHADAVIFADKALMRVMCQNGVGPGTFYFNYSNATIYIGDDPTNRSVEAAVSTGAISIDGGSGVTIQNLTIKNFATSAQQAAVDSKGDWLIKNNEVANTGGAGIRMGGRTIDNYAHHNAQYGIIGGGTGRLLADNEIAYNNTALYDMNWGAGATKFWESTNMTVRGNYVHDNQGRGLWDDTDNKGIIYENNHTKNNWGNGIFHEIGEDAKIFNNLSENDGLKSGGTSMYYDGGIYVNTSQNTEIYNNTVINSNVGIGGTAASRGNSLLYGFVFTLSNIYVHDNYIQLKSGPAAGFESSVGNAVFTSNNNRYVHNQYCVPTTATYVWMAGNRTNTQWKGYGQDTTGVWSCTLTKAPAVTSPLTRYANGGAAFQYQISATNVPTKYNATGLPSGLSVNTTSGLLSGTPGTAGTYSITLQATNAAGTGSAILTLIVYPNLSPVPVITSAATAAGVVNKSFSFTVTSNPAATTYSATGLPAGLALNTTSGVISGTPPSTGKWTVAIKATNSSGTGSANLTLTVNPPAPAVTSALTAATSIGVNLSYTIKGSNTPTSYSASPIPSWMTLNPTSGAFYGIPPTGNGGTYSVKIGAANAGGTGTATLVITVTPLPPAVTSPLTASGTAGTNLSYSIRGSYAPTSYSATPLPAWATLNPATGALYGIPTSAGAYTITLGATNAGGTGHATLKVSVVAAALQLQPAPLSANQTSPVRAYPNPWRKDQTPEIPIKFDHLDPASDIRIFTISGRLIRSLSAAAVSEATWDLKNDSGQDVASGLYIYLIHAGANDPVRGTLAVIR